MSRQKVFTFGLGISEALEVYMCDSEADYPEEAGQPWIGIVDDSANKRLTIKVHSDFLNRTVILKKE